MTLHDDHCWLTVEGSAWAIRGIKRWPETWRFFLWRGYEPNLEYAQIDMTGEDWMATYADAAARLLDEAARNANRPGPTPPIFPTP